MKNEAFDEYAKSAAYPAFYTTKMIAEQAFEAGQRHEREWIKVADRLPLKQEDVVNYASVEVLVATRNNEVFASEFAMGNTHAQWHQFGEFEDGYITHWMPLPDPPVKP